MHVFGVNHGSETQNTASGHHWSSGTAEANHRSSYQDVYSLSIRSVDSNTGTQYIGDETVDSTNGMPMVNGDTVEIDTPDSMSKEGFDPTKIYVVASAANQEFRVTVFIRDRSK
jgi:hypothetical protein